GVDPKYMGIGPVPAVKALLKKTGFGLKDIDVFEVNEAFAAQALAVCRRLELPPERTNPNGSGISLGHARRHRLPPDHQGAVRAEADRRPAGAGDHVHRRRPGHRGHLRATVTGWRTKHSSFSKWRHGHGAVGR